MYEIGKSILNFILLVTTVWIVNKYLNSLFLKKKYNLFSIISWLIFIIFQGIVEFGDKYGKIWITVTVLLVTYAISIFCYQKAGIKKLIYITLLYVIWSAVEIIVIALFRNAEISENMKYDIGEVMSKIIMVLIVQVLTIYVERNDRNNIPFKYNIILLFIPLGSIFILANEFFFTVQKNSVIFSMISYSIILIINIQVFEVYLKLTQFFDLEKEKIVYRQQIEQMTNKINEQNKVVDDFYRNRHDLVNELIVVKNNIDSCNYNNAQKALEHIMQSKENDVFISKSGNKIVDAIINFKYAAIKDFHISFSLKITIPDKISIDECDMGIVLGNAIDNAIEATKACKMGKKNIDIIMGIKKGSIVLIVRNPYENRLKRSRNGELLSTKKDSEGHGYGIGAIRNIAEKYSGDVLIDTDNNLFTIMIIMNIRELCQ